MKKKKRKKISKTGQKNFKLEEVMEMRRELKGKLTQRITQEVMVVMVYKLRDMHGFGFDRMTKYLDEIYETFDSIDKGYVSINDIKKAVQNELQIEIK